MNYSCRRTLRLCILIVALTFLIVQGVFAGPKTQAGPYRVEVVSDPPVIPVGKATLQIKITDTASGAPVKGAIIHALTKMPTMDMGEREQPGTAQATQAGLYNVPAQFAMEGGYESTIKIDGPLGSATARLPLQTGQNTTTAEVHTLSPTPVVGVVLALLIIGGVLWRVRVTDQRVAWRTILNRQVIGSLFLLGIITAGAMYGVNHLRRPGALTPVEAQAMDMSYLPPPPGYQPVELATVTHGRVRSTVPVSGTAVGFVEQDVAPRIAGTLVFMPLYAGDRVRKGQIIARLDTSQTAPQTAQKRAAADMARQGVGVAEAEAQQSKAEVGQAHAELAGKQGALSEAQAGVGAARNERESSQASLASAQAQGDDARAQVTAAQADQTYWQAQIARSEALLKAGAISGEEYQRDKAQAASADAKVKQAQARIAQMGAEVRAAQAALRGADAQINAAQARVAMAKSELAAHYAHVRSAQAAATTAGQKVGQAQSAVREAQAGAQAAEATQGYGIIRSEIDGVVTQRLLSPGVLVAPGQTMVRIAQVSPLRLQANVSETDLARVHVGSPVQISARNDKRKPITARVTSVAPAVDPASRTGIVEVIIPNTDGRLVPGQFVLMDIATGVRADTLRVPTRALHYGTPASDGVLPATSQATLWVADKPGEAGQFTARRVSVQTGITDGNTTEIIAGVKEGQLVVVSGGADLKEGDHVAEVNADKPLAADGDSKETATTNAQTASVTVTDQGFQPSTLKLAAGVPARVTFTRTSEQTCATEVLFPDNGIKKALPLNQPVMVEFVPKKGEIGFSCGMNAMVKGKVVAQ